VREEGREETGGKGGDGEMGRGGRRVQGVFERKEKEEGEGM